MFSSLMPKYHPYLTPAKWSAKPKITQILNIAAELSRSKHWIDKNDPHEIKNCLNRAFELIDLTIADCKWSNGLKELLRFRELLADFYIRADKDFDYFQKLFRVWLNFDAQSALVKI